MIQKPPGSSASWSVPKLAEVKGENPLGRTPALPQRLSCIPAPLCVQHGTLYCSSPHPASKERMKLQAVNTDLSLSVEASLLELVAAEKMSVS